MSCVMLEPCTVTDTTVAFSLEHQLTLFTFVKVTAVSHFTAVQGFKDQGRPGSRFTYESSSEEVPPTSWSCSSTSLQALNKTISRPASARAPRNQGDVGQSRTTKNPKTHIDPETDVWNPTFMWMSKRKQSEPFPIGHLYVQRSPFN